MDNDFNRTLSERIWQKRRSYPTHAADFPVKAAEYAQLDSGDADFERIVVWGSCSFIIRARFRPRAVFSTVPEPDWVAFNVPLSWRGDYRLNGWLASPGDVFLVDGRESYSSVAAERDGIMIGLHRVALASACAALGGCDADDIDLSPRHIEAGDRPNAGICHLVQRMILAATASGHCQAGFCITAAQEADMISGIADWLVTEVDSPPSVLSSRCDPARVVRMVEESARQRGFDLMSLADLCAASGVKKSRLHECFVDVYGISPSEFIRKLRMSMAREWLLDTSDPPTSVKDAALRFGFLHLGRFSISYRALFGEHPSATLDRTRIHAEKRLTVSP